MVTDEVAQRIKGLEPVVPLDERLAIVAGIRYVDEAVVEDVPHKLEMWERLRFNVIIKGDDWKGTDRGDKLESRLRRGRASRSAYVPYTTADVEHDAAAAARRASSTASEPTGTARRAGTGRRHDRNLEGID